MQFVKQNTTLKFVYFVEYSSVGICPVFFLRLDVGYEFGKEYYRGDVSLSYQAYHLSMWLITIDVNLGHLAEIGLVRFLYWEVMLFVSHFIVCSLEESPSVQPILKKWGVMHHLLEDKISSKIVWNSSRMTCIFCSMYFFSLCKYRCMNTYYILLV